MPHFAPKPVFQCFLAPGDLLPRLGGAQMPQVAVGGGMGPDLMPGSQPFADLDLIHQPFRHVAFGRIPFVGSAEGARNQELDGGKPVARQGSKPLLEHAAAAVIEGDDNAFSRPALARQDIGQWSRAIATPTQSGQLRVEPPGADLKEGIGRAPRGRADFMVGQDRQTAPGEPALGRPQEDSG